MEEFLSNIPNTTEVIGVLIIGIVLLVVSFVRKLDKLAVVTLIGMIIYAGYNLEHYLDFIILEFFLE